MPTPVTIVLIILSVAAALVLLSFVLYALVFVRPRGEEPKDKTLLCDYAHRGLHGGGVPENSLEAFELACKAGYGIELDIQLSRDGEVMVFHDYTLSRMTGCNKRLCELDAAELSALSLAGTEQGIPTLREVLALVDGRVPILVELKGESFDTSLCPKAAKLLKEYNGRFCIESFNPLLVKEMKRLLSNAFCGLLYTNTVRDKKSKSLLNIVITTMALNFVCKPNFISYNEVDRESFPVKLSTKFYRTPKFVWTVRSCESLDKAHELGELPIFEKLDRQ